MDETYGWILIKLDTNKLYFVQTKTAGVLQVPRHEVYTRQGKVLLMKEPRQVKDCICLKVVFEPNKFCWEDEEV
jgi:hypothetical protein